jgi:hypothetical protein
LAQDMLRHIAADQAAAAPTSTYESTERKGHVTHRSFEDVAFLPPLFDDTDSNNSGDDDNDGDEDEDDNGLQHSGTQYGTSPRRTSHRTHHRTTTSATNSQCRLYFSGGYMTVLLQAILHSTLLWIALPCAIAALILYYPFANPVIDFLPGSVTIAWWFNFTARQMVTLEVARLLQYIIVESLLLKSRWERSQLVSFVAYHIQGWPFILISWGTIDLFVLHGSNRYQVHWLWWTRWKIYSHEASSGAYMLTSELYLRILLSMIFFGVATAMKRCIVELQFGGRLHRTFKPKLEQILRVCSRSLRLRLHT